MRAPFSWCLRERKSLRTAYENPKTQKQPTVGKTCEYVGLPANDHTSATTNHTNTPPLPIP